MRIIWYVLDGLTPCMVRSFVDKKESKVSDLAPLNYIDKLAKGSFIIKNCYGHGETMASLPAMLTGRDVNSLKSDMPSHPDAYHRWPTVADYLKKSGFFTIIYRNFPPDGLRRKGPYVRYNSLESKGFDNVCLEDEVGFIKDSKFVSKRDDFFLLKSKKPVYIFIHDLSLHDHPLVQRHGTKKGLAKGIVECSERLRKNLEYLNYKKDKDILIFSSDHGMTLGPYDDLFFDKNISESKINRYWPKMIADFKLKTCFFIKGPGISPGIAAGTFEIRDMFSTALDFLHIKHRPTGAVSAKNNTRTSALISVAGSPYEHTGWKKVGHWFHPYIVYIEGSKKWIYRRSEYAKSYFIDLNQDKNEDNPVEITFIELPSKLRLYVKKYFSSSRTLGRLFYAYHPKRIFFYFMARLFIYGNYPEK